MTATCPCCGHAATGATDALARPTHWVDADVLACFNAAHAEAERRGAVEVDLGHLLLMIARANAARSLWLDHGLDASVLAAVVETALGSNTARRGRPRTASDLHALLDITQRTAAMHGNACVSLRHVFATLLDPPLTLRAGPAISRWLWAARRYPPQDRRGASRVHNSGARSDSDSADDERQDRRHLLARLARQEQMLQDLLARLASLTEQREHDMRAAADRATFDSAEQRSAAASIAAAPSPAIADPAALASIEAEVRRARAAAPLAASKSDPSLDDLADDIAADPGQEPDPELEKLGVRRYYLALDDDIVRAPSIGPRTADRLRPHGLTHVKHLLACEPERLSARLGARHLTASRIAAWKNQARLVCTIPWLRGTHAQLLVGAGYASIEKILSTDRSVVCAAVMQFSTTRDGQSILRAGPPPELDRIMRWIENSQQSEPQRGQWGRAQLN